MIMIMMMMMILILIIIITIIIIIIIIIIVIIIIIIMKPNKQHRRPRLSGVGHAAGSTARGPAPFMRTALTAGGSPLPTPEERHHQAGQAAHLNSSPPAAAVLRWHTAQEWCGHPHLLMPCRSCSPPPRLASVSQSVSQSVAPTPREHRNKHGAGPCSC